MFWQIKKYITYNPNSQDCAVTSAGIDKLTEGTE